MYMYTCICIYTCICVCSLCPRLPEAIKVLFGFLGLCSYIYIYIYIYIYVYINMYIRNYAEFWFIPIIIQCIYIYNIHEKMHVLMQYIEQSHISIIPKVFVRDIYIYVYIYIYIYIYMGIYIIYIYAYIHTCIYRMNAEWYLDTSIPRYLDTLIPWYLDTSIPWYLDTLIPWCLVTSIPWYFDTLKKFILFFQGLHG
jgi:hypothetical protein